MSPGRGTGSMEGPAVLTATGAKSHDYGVVTSNVNTIGVSGQS
jgi:hypothetical protein